MSRLGRGYPANRIIRPKLLPIAPSVAFDAVGAGYQSPGTSPSNVPTWTPTITGNGITVFVDTFNNGTITSVSVTVGGTAMTPNGSVSNYFFTSPFTAGLYGFSLLNPPAGAVVVTIAGTGLTAIDVIANSESYSNVTGFGTAVTGSGTGTPSISASSTSGQMVAQAFGGYTTTFTAYTQTQRYNKALGGASLAFVMGDAPGAGSVTFGAANGSDAWGAIAIPVL